MRAFTPEFGIGIRAAFVRSSGAVLSSVRGLRNPRSGTRVSGLRDSGFGTRVSGLGLRCTYGPPYVSDFHWDSKILEDSVDDSKILKDSVERKRFQGVADPSCAPAKVRAAILNLYTHGATPSTCR